MEADIWRSAIPAKARANRAYAEQLRKAFENRALVRRDGTKWTWGRRTAEGGVAELVGAPYEEFYMASPIGVDGIDEEIADDLLQLGWRPA